MKPRISMITLGVKDLEVAINFYEKGLGFPKIPSPPEVAFFNLNGTWLGLFGREDLAKDANITDISGDANNGNSFAGFSLAHNVESEKEVDEVIAKAIKVGAVIVKPPQKVFWGGYSGYFKDPDGYLWEIAHNPFFWVGPKDE